MNDQDERHELLGRLETPPEFKDWASNTLPTPGISNGHQTMSEGRGTSEHETSQLSPLALRGPADTGRLSEGQNVKQGRLWRHFSRVFREIPPLRGLFTNIRESIKEAKSINQPDAKQTGN